MWHDSNFPNLNTEGYDITSPPTPRYNCIAWAGGDDWNWWEPDPFGIYFWPANAPGEYTIASYKAAFQALGYLPCDSPDLEPVTEKVALYALADGQPTHAARQTPDGKWTSKLGSQEDITHTLTGLEGPIYGRVVMILKRRMS